MIDSARVSAGTPVDCIKQGRVNHQPSEEKLLFLYQNRPVSRISTSKPTRIMTGRPMSMSASAKSMKRPYSTVGRMRSPEQVHKDKPSTALPVKRPLEDEDVY